MKCAKWTPIRSHEKAQEPQKAESYIHVAGAALIAVLSVCGGVVIGYQFAVWVAG
jgi:hypothetical protein